jgi:YihY family inner membrane protein
MDALAPVRAFDRYQQTHKPLALLIATIKKFSDDQAGNLAVVVAFYAFFSLFPLLLVFVTVLGYVLAGDTSLMSSVSSSVLGRFPMIGTAIENHHLSGDALALILGILLSAWSGSGVTGAMSSALEQVWEIPRRDRASYVNKKLRGLLLLLVLGVLFIVASAASGFVSAVIGGWAWAIVGFVVAAAVNFCLFMTAFHFLCEEPPHWRELMPGAAAAAILWSFLQLLGGIYINHISKGDSTYGRFALVLGILTWLHLGTQMTLYCAEFNTVLAGKRWPRSLFDDPDDQPSQARPLGGLTVGEVSES